MSNVTVANNVSSLAKQLKNYWQGDIDISLARRGGNGNGSSGGGASAAGVHSLDGLLHTGEIANSQAPQFALLDGSRTYTGDISFPPGGGQTVDGVDISAHAADPNAHHFRATAGDGIYVSPEQEINIEIVPNVGLAFTGGGALTIQVHEGIEVNSGYLRVDEDYEYTWEAIHHHNNNLDFTGDWSITGTSDLTIDLADDLILADDQRFRSDTYLDGIPISGFSLHTNPAGQRQLTIAALKADEMHVRAFTADMVRVDVGEEWWGKSVAILYQDFTTPGAIDGTGTLVMEDNPAIDGQIFAGNDWVMMRVIDLPAAGSTGPAAVAYVWGQVSSYVNLAADENGIGRQQQTFTLRSGPTNTTIKKGNVVVGFGAVGQGFVHLSALNSAQGPWIRIGDWTGATPFAAGSMQPRTQIGRLDGLADSELNPAGWGLYSDNAYLHGMLRTTEAILDDDGLALEYPDNDLGAVTPAADEALISWWPDLDDRTGDPAAMIYGHTFTTPAPSRQDSAGFIVTRQDASDHAELWLWARDTDEVIGGSLILLNSADTIDFISETIRAGGDLLPAEDLIHDLGTASLRWRQLHVDQLFVTGSISGDTLSGAEWEFAGSMIIDAHSSSPTSVTSFVNQGTGTA